MTTPVGNLPAATSITAADYIPVEQAGVLKRATPDLLPFAQSGTAPTARTVQDVLRSAVRSGDYASASNYAARLALLTETWGFNAIDLKGALTGSGVMATSVVGDTNNRHLVEATGAHSWGPGNAATDIAISRGGAHMLLVDPNGVGAAQVQLQTNDIAGVTSPFLRLGDFYTSFGMYRNSDLAVWADAGDMTVRSSAGNVVIYSSSGVDLVGTPTSGTAGHIKLGSTTQGTIGANGAASALTANPLGYLIFYVGTTKAVIPYYNS